MKRKRYTEERIIRILGEIESGKTVAETCRKYNVSESVHYRGSGENALRYPP